MLFLLALHTEKYGQILSFPIFWTLQIEFTQFLDVEIKYSNKTDTPHTSRRQLDKCSMLCKLLVGWLRKYEQNFFSRAIETLIVYKHLSFSVQLNDYH